MLNVAFDRQKGLSIIELMVGIAVGVIVMFVAISVFVANLRGSSDTLRQVRLNEELNAATAFMTNDIRRAGYWGAARSGVNNPFTNPTGPTDIVISGSCILYSYDAVFATNYSDTTAVELGDFFGFRRSSDGVLQTRIATVANNSSCSGDTWTNLTDPNVVFIESLTFSFEGSACIDVSLTTGTNTAFSASSSTTPPCPSTANSGTGFATAGHSLLESRVIVIDIQARHVADPNLKKRLRSTVAVRNDRFVQL